MKMFKAGRLLLTIPILIASASCPAQDAASQPPQAQQPTLKMNPIAALKAFEPAADQPYELGRGDEISVEVMGRPELTGPHVIGPDGDITLPIVGSVQVADNTREQAAIAIQNALRTYYEGVTVAIGVNKYTSNQILLLGAVEHPGLMTFDKTPTLLEVISRGGLELTSSGGGGGSSSAAKPIAVPEECMIYRGNEQMITVELRSLLDEGNPLANMRLKRDDTVYIPGANKFVSVMGQVGHPGNLRLDRTSTLSDLLSEAGGPTEKAGKNPVIQIIHRGTGNDTGTTQKVLYSDLLTPKSLDLSLHSGDIVYIAQSGFNNFAYTLEKIAPLVNVLTIGSLLK
jgi:polysaccharide biosynthesis/export protein